jgi:hypothetical protein
MTDLGQKLWFFYTGPTFVLLRDPREFKASATGRRPVVLLDLDSDVRSLDPARTRGPGLQPGPAHHHPRSCDLQTHPNNLPRPFTGSNL